MMDLWAKQNTVGGGIRRKSAQIGRKAGKFDERANFTARRRVRAASTIHLAASIIIAIYSR